MTIFKNQRYIAYYLGNPNLNCHINDVYSKNPRKDINSKRLIAEIIKNIDSSGIYALISRIKMDINRPMDDIINPQY